jgi:hypothetical protein
MTPPLRSFFAQWLLISVALSLGIKYGLPYLPIPATPVVLAILIGFPVLVVALLLIRLELRDRSHPSVGIPRGRPLQEATRIGDPDTNEPQALDEVGS